MDLQRARLRWPVMQTIIWNNLKSTIGLDMVKLKSVDEAVISPAATLMSEVENNCFIMPKSCCVIYCTSNIQTNPELCLSVLPLRKKDSKRRALWLQASSPFKWQRWFPPKVGGAVKWRRCLGWGLLCCYFIYIFSHILPLHNVALTVWILLKSIFRSNFDQLCGHHTVAAPDIFFWGCCGVAWRFIEGAQTCRVSH